MTHAQTTPDAIATWVVDALNDLKAHDVHLLDVSDMTTMTDRMVIASGTSGRHVRAMAEKVAAQAKQAFSQPAAMEGADESEWVLVDLGPVLVHLMQPRTRAFYNLEGLWGPAEVTPAISSVAPAPTV